MKTLIALVLAAAAVSAVQAQTVWRCGPDGRTFSDTPCRDGKALESPLARPVADVYSAQEVAEREKALADRLVQERQQRERQVVAGAAGINGSRLVKPSDVRKARPQAKPHRLEASGTWPAAAPSFRRARD